MKIDNFFANLTANPESEIFEILAGNSKVKIERIISLGQSTPPGDWYDQEMNEWVILLEGFAGILFEGEPTIHILNPGDYLLIPAHVRHRVEFTDKYKPSVWLAVHYLD